VLAFAVAAAESRRRWVWHPWVVPRLGMSSTGAPTRTERQVGPPVTRLRPVNRVGWRLVHD